MPSDPIRYPDPNIKILDPRFGALVLGNAAIERIADGCRFTEGPVWFGDLRCLLWTDIPNDRIMKWEEETGAVSLFRKPSHSANGNTRDRQGRLGFGTGMGPEHQQLRCRAGFVEKETAEHLVVGGDLIVPGDQGGPARPVQVEQVGRVQ